MQPFIAGTAVTFISDGPPFTSIDGVTLVNPDEVTFTYKVNGVIIDTFTWVNPSGDPEAMITKVSTGIFKISIDSTGLSGLWEYSWTSKAFSGVDVTGTQVAWKSPIFQVAPSLTNGAQ